MSALGVAAGCDAEDPGWGSTTATYDALEDASFRCAPDNLPAIGGLNSVTISGTPSIFTPLDRDIDVFSNGNITISGTGFIDAGAYSAKGNVSFVSGGSVTGTVKKSGIDRPSVDIYDSAWIGSYILGGNNGASALGKTNKNRNPLAAAGSSYNYTIYGSDWDHFTRSLYHFHNVSITGYSDVTLAYTVTYVYVTGSVTISSGAWVGSGWGSDLMIISNSTSPITITGLDTWFSGRIYAPYAPITVSGGAWVTGSIVGASLNVSGDSIVEVSNDALGIWLPC